MPRRPRTDVWQDLAAVKAPTVMVRGLRSDRWDNPAILARLTSDYTKVAIVTVDAQHDVADQAPDALIAHVRKFTATT
jgi:predicted alpha/beta-hydrolase family hydrolase